jgi:hypothetical protein
MSASRLLSQSELSRLLNVSPPRLTRAIRAGQLKPDHELNGGRFGLRFFNADRLPEIRALLLAHKPEVTL